MQGVDEPWMPTERQSELATKARKIQEEIETMEAALPKLIHAKPPNVQAVNLAHEAIRAGREKLRQVRESQAVEDARVLKERFGR